MRLMILHNDEFNHIASCQTPQFHVASRRNFPYSLRERGLGEGVWEIPSASDVKLWCLATWYVAQLVIIQDH